MLAAIQDGGEQILIGPQVLQWPLANVGAKMLKMLIDLLERQVESKLTHPLEPASRLLPGNVPDWSKRSGLSNPLFSLSERE